MPRCIPCPNEEKTEGSSDSKGKIEVKLHELKSNPYKLESFDSSLKSCKQVGENVVVASRRESCKQVGEKVTAP
jgi:chaperonin cofactor prefoldin